MQNGCVSHCDNPTVERGVVGEECLIEANVFFNSHFSRTFFDVEMFNPYAKSCSRSMPDSYKHHKAIKKHDSIYASEKVSDL